MGGLALTTGLEAIRGLGVTAGLVETRGIVIAGVWGRSLEVAILELAEALSSQA